MCGQKRGGNGFRYQGQCGMDNKLNMYVTEYSAIQYSSRSWMGCIKLGRGTYKENIIFLLSIGYYCHRGKVRTK